jgi:hypothetical protein
MEGDAFADTEEALKEWEVWETEHALAGSAFSATDEALVALNDALANELTTFNSMKSNGTVLEGREKARDVVRAAGRFVGYLNTNVFGSEVQQTESLLADCNSLVTELGTIDANRKEVSFIFQFCTCALGRLLNTFHDCRKQAQEVQTELKNVMAAHLKASEAVIRNHAEFELLRLHGTIGEQQSLFSSHAFELNSHNAESRVTTTGDADVFDVETKLSSAKKSVADLAERQAAFEAKLAGFAQSNMPELLWSADPKLAKRLLHTGLVVDRRLSDYEQLEGGAVQVESS